MCFFSTVRADQRQVHITLAGLMTHEVCLAFSSQIRQAHYFIGVGVLEQGFEPGPFIEANVFGINCDSGGRSCPRQERSRQAPSDPVDGRGHIFDRALDLI